MKHLRLRRGTLGGDAARALALALLMVPLVLLPGGCGSGATTETAGNPAKQPIDFGAVKNGRVVAFLNVDSRADYTVKVDGTAILGPGKVRSGKVWPFSSKSRLEVSAECTDGAVTLTPRGPYDVVTSTGTAKIIFFDVGTSTNGIFTTPIGVIVQTD